MKNLLRSAAVSAISAFLPFLLLAACGDSSPTDVPADIEGTYTLETVNGEVVPFEIFEDEEATYVLEGGTFELRADMSYTETIDFEIIYVDEEQEPESDPAIENGTYSVEGSSIRFDVPATDDDPAFSYEGTVSGDTLTYSVQGVVAVYTRN